MKLRVLMIVATCLLAGSLAACGGSEVASEEARTPTRAVVVRCLEHAAVEPGGTGARIHQRQLPAEIGGLPAHAEIWGVGYSEKGELFGPVTAIYLFKESDEGEEGAEVIEGEYPGAEVARYAGDKAVSVIVPQKGAGTPNPKNAELVEECIGSAPEG